MPIVRLHLALALHNHQPVGNFGWVLERNFEESYLPMLEALERHPRIKAALHYSGFLLDHLREHHPQFIKRVRGLVERGQVEVLGGGYFEPILPIISDRDKLVQLKLLRDAVTRDFGRRPSGLWLAERVWEPGLPRPLAEAGYGYTILDNEHFEAIGIRAEALLQPFLTEEQGHAIVVLPTLKVLRYAIPWQPVEQVMEILRGLAGEGERLALMGDDGEKFGSWPTTHEACWDRGWVDEFFNAIEASAGWLDTVLPGAYVETHRPHGPVYLPATSYPEMIKWSGGFWRNFLARYREANAMHKKMLRVSRSGRPSRHLLQAQANDAYWHGVFGGVYLPHLRRAVWQNLRAAEGAGRRLVARVSEEDYDLDGHREVLFEGPEQNVYVAPAAGGAIVEWDAGRLNLVDVVQRRPEAYHEELRAGSAQGGGILKANLLVREPGLHERLWYDRRRRLLFQCYLVPAEARLDAAQRGQLEELGSFGTGGFLTRLRSRRLKLDRTETVGGQSVTMTKELTVDGQGRSITLSVRVEPLPPGSLLAVESNLAITAGPAKGSLTANRRTHCLDGEVEIAEAASLVLLQPELATRCTVRISPPARIWYYPVETINNSEHGYERILQGGCLVTLHAVGQARLTIRQSDV